MASILIIDDEPLVRSYVRMILEPVGHIVIEAHDGESGLRVFQTKSVALVICDILMPGREGLDTIVDLRRLAPEVKIIAVSGGSSFAQHQDILTVAKAIGADDVLAKPFSPDSLVTKVRTLLSATSP